jgi:uncharacterized membrane protein
MAEINAVSEEDKDADLLAGLCYVPVLMISILAPLYVLLAKKGGQYARFHAIQSLCLTAVILVVNSVLAIVFMLSFPMIFFSAVPAHGTAVAPDAFMKTWSSMMLGMIPLAAVSALVLIMEFFLAYKAYIGKGVRLPLIAGLAERK